MSKKEVNQLSAIRREAALARWRGREKASFRTIRVREDVLAALARVDGGTWSERIETLMKLG
jgi:hypothetical protein